MNRFAFYIVMACLAAMLIDCTGGKSVVREGQVIDLVHVAPSTSWTTDSDSNLKLVSTSETYTIVVHVDDGTIEKVDTDTPGYYSVKAGQHLSYHARWGWLSHHDWSPHYYLD